MIQLVCDRAGLAADALVPTGLVLGQACSSSPDPVDVGEDMPAASAPMLMPQNESEIYVLPERLPAGYSYVSVELPTEDTHVTFVGAVAAADDVNTIRLSLRWRQRPDLSGTEEDRPEEPAGTQVAGREVHLYEEQRTARVPFGPGTDVWLTFDAPFEELPAGLFDRIVGSLVEVPQQQWERLLLQLDEPLAFDDPELAGLCETLINDFVEGEPSPSPSVEAVAATFVLDNQILEGLIVQDGRILHRGEQVGRYSVVERPADTFAVESAEWCYPNG